MARPMMLASASGELYTRSLAERALQAPGHLEDAALALHVGRGCPRGCSRPRPRRRRRSAGSRVISSRRQMLSRSTMVVGSPAEVRIVLGVELLGGGIDVGRVDVAGRSCRWRAGARRAPRRPRPGPPPRPARAMQVELGLGGDALLEQVLGKPVERIALGVGLPLGRRAVVHLVVRQRVAVGPDDLGVHQRRPLPRAGVVHRLRQRRRRRRARRSRPPPG